MKNKLVTKNKKYFLRTHDKKMRPQNSSKTPIVAFCIILKLSRNKKNNYSPLHNLKGVFYPATFVTTADHDDRVVPAHSFKFAATLQADNAGPDPTLIRIESKAGHGAGKPISKAIEEQTDIWSFVMWGIGMEYKN